MGVRQNAVVLGALLVVALFAAPAVGTATAWNDGDEDDDRFDDGETNRSVSESAAEVREAVENTTEQASDSVDTATERTADTIETTVEQGSVTARNASAPGAAGPSEPEATDVTVGVGVGDSTAVPAVDREGASRTAGVSVLADVGEDDARGAGIAIRFGSVRERGPDVGRTPPGRVDLGPGPDVEPVPDVDPAVPGEPTTAAGDGTPATAPATGIERPTVGGDGGRSRTGDLGGPADDAAVAGSGVRSESIIDPLPSFTAVPVPGTAIPVWAFVFLFLLKPLVSALSAAVAVLTDLGSRLAVSLRFGNDSEDPLEHDRRATIKRIVGDSPGITLSELAERADTTLSTIRHHVKVLERERLVTSRKIRGKRRFFPRGVDNEELIAALDDGTAGTIIEALQDRGRATVGDLVDATDRSYSTVSHHLERLSEDGIVVQTREGASKLTRLAPWAEAALDAEHGEPAADAHEVGAD